MKKAFIVLLFNAILLSANAQIQRPPMPDSIKSFLDTVVNIIHKEALNRDSVNWDSIKKEVYHKAGPAQRIADLIPAVCYIFEQLHDNHGALVYKGIQHGARKAKPQYNKELIAQMQIAGVFKLKVKVLDDNYGYILIPSIETSNMDDYNKYAQEIKDSICSVYSKKIKGWIIDLRLNPGGNMWPMLGGIGNIIGDGKVGSLY